MSLFRNLSLLTKITVIVAGILVVFFGLNSLLHYRQVKSVILDEALQKAREAAFHAVHTREYLSEQYQSRGIELSAERYALIPVVASNRIGRRVAEDLGYSLRQTSDRYRNPDNAPDSFELEVLKRFRAQPDLEEYYTEVSAEQGPFFRYMVPFEADSSCMPCHGDPQQAPDFIREMFPPERDQAYNYQLGEVIGAVSVSIPMSEILQRLQANLNRDLLANGANFLALITCLGILIRFAVTRPLRRLGEATSEILRTGRFDRVLSRRGRDEIGRLIDGFNEMVAGLGEKTRELEESEQRFRLLTDNAGDGIISFLENGQIILFNRRAEKLFGYSKREALGMDVAKLVHPDANKGLHKIGTAEYLRIHGDKLMKNVHRIVGLQRDGSAIEMEVSLSLAVSDGHRFYTAIIRFTERKAPVNVSGSP
ncbi:MAG: DUF3365 domain-containing protein [Thermodesulfobacteriota bacterium]|jgi:PAS domain S-box-containing protein|nr:DUF3365 domain-containing protein [Thermodesulfobacteriota bacterium]